MDEVRSVLEAIDSPWPLLGLVVLAVWFLVDKYAKQILELLIVNATKTEQIQTAIVTNHGSKNIGDAIDRLTSSVIVVEAEQKDQKAIMLTVVREQQRLREELAESKRPGHFIVQEDEPSASGF